MTEPTPPGQVPQGPSVPPAPTPPAPVPGGPAPSLPAPAPATATLDLSDGEWHRMHPLTPLMKGGLVLLVVLSMVVANMRERLISIFLPSDVRDVQSEYDGDPIDWVLANNFVLLAIIAVAVVIALVVAAMWVSWRFHQVRIADGAVEVRKGIVFRSQRRAPLDRVQGVNLTRPFPARLIGLAKLEVVGAGADANVQLEYLSTRNAERVRADILRFASGARRAKEAARHPGAVVDPATGAAHVTSRGADLVQAFGDNVTGIVMGEEEPVAAPQSVVAIPFARLLASHVISGTTLFLLLYIAGIVVAVIFAGPVALAGMLPAIFGFGAYYVGGLMKMLRFAIAPTPDGIRVTAGLTTTITETIPPGRIHAVQVSQSLMWRPFGWYRITINRLSGRSATDQAKDPFSTLLPVGTRDDVIRVLALLFPTTPPADLAALVGPGFDVVPATDPYTVSPRRAWWEHPLARRRNGFLLVGAHLLLRRGFMWRRLGIFPLERVQSLALSQGPLQRATALATLEVNVVAGLVSGNLRGVSRDDALDVFDRAERAALAAARGDRSHRWGEDEAAAEAEGLPVLSGDATTTPDRPMPGFERLVADLPAVADPQIVPEDHTTSDSGADDAR